MMMCDCAGCDRPAVGVYNVVMQTIPYGYHRVSLCDRHAVKDVWRMAAEDPSGKAVTILVPMTARRVEGNI